MSEVATFKRADLDASTAVRTSSIAAFNSFVKKLIFLSSSCLSDLISSLFPVAPVANAAPRVPFSASFFAFISSIASRCFLSFSS